MANLLAAETSPYLLQHQHNPVDWRPWGDDALEAARSADKPLLISIGYSACHWCHVMERESFEDPDVAAVMNEHFVCVKVDREERPDVDAIYMDAVQAMAGHGGWPLNMFITPEQVPFYGGTYFPPQPRPGMPSWVQVLESVAEAWRERREEIRSSAGRITARLAGAAELAPSSEPIDGRTLDAAVARLAESFDSANGGFGGAPKFPPASIIEFLLRRGHKLDAQSMALQTLRAMASGGIYDQVGGGFARYSVDAHWLVPHFEKMLYDNALLARAYLHGFQVSGDRLLLQVARETLDWALREMRAPEGGFYAALDADSEGVEGKFYVWTIAELRAALGDLADDAIAYFGAGELGNFEGRNILLRAGTEPAALNEIRRRLYDVREQRVRPGLDDKRLCSWNALMISALAETGAVLRARDGDDAERAGDYLDAAVACAGFILSDLRSDEGRLLRSYNRGQAKLGGLLEDHAFLLEALLTLYESTFEERFFIEARRLADTMIERFADPRHGGFFATPTDHEALLTRRKDLDDSPIPSGSSSAAYGLLRLAALTGEHDYETAAVGALRLIHELAPRHPQAFGHGLQAIDFYASRTREIALVGSDVGPLERTIRAAFRPHVVLAGGAGGGAVPLLEGRSPVDGLATAYVCERFACQRPVTDPQDLAALLG
ncbi:MAG TPA: thioredoxin domain-containing protein [Solirubrobacteraceae bacterium]|nr:thioredoxin domain-containing protein [Solirubrobacteraceae bacterium]